MTVTGSPCWASTTRSCDRSSSCFRGHELNTLGDGFVATFDGPRRAGVRCATAIIEKLRPLGIEVRCGLHTGEIEIGHDDVGGIAVHTAARVADLASRGRGPRFQYRSGTSLPAPAFSSATAAATHSADYRRRCEYSRPESGLLQILIFTSHL